MLSNLAVADGKHDDHHLHILTWARSPELTRTAPGKGRYVIHFTLEDTDHMHDVFEEQGHSSSFIACRMTVWALLCVLGEAVAW